MVVEVARYQFQSWARRGIAAQINEVDALGAPAATLPLGERASVPIGVSINAAPQPATQFELVGPGDIVGVQRDMIVRTEPRNWITNFEPNYLAFIEFYDEDFPWRYTPARPDGERLRPWIQLLVLEEGEFTREDRRVPLPVVTVKSKAALPAADETWLFAHVHTEEDIGAGDLSDLEAYLKSLQAATTADPDKIYSRLLSPRRLAPNRAYQAFVVPAFEVGRLAGLGRDPAGVPAQKPAWDASSTGAELPFYYDWSFRTGEQADFESLVRLLQPRILDPRIGVRRMDCSAPGFVRVDDQGRERPPAPGEPPGLPAATPPIQGLEGALRTDRTSSTPPTFTPNAFQAELQILVNLPETAPIAGAATPPDDEFLNDPVVTMPLYGRNHARQYKTDKVLLDTTKDGWCDDLNRDPRTRVPAGLGTTVIQKHQERLMQRAWRQLQTVHDANRAIRQVQFTLQVSSRYMTQFFAQLAPAHLLAVTAPIHAKVMGSPTTIRQQLAESRLVTPIFSAAFRRAVRPAGKLARRLGGAADLPAIAAALNEGRDTPAPPRQVPAGLPSIDDLADRARPQPLPGGLAWLVRSRTILLLVLLVGLVVLGAATGGWILAAVGAVGLFGAYAWLREQARLQAAAVADADAIAAPQPALAALTATPPRPTFRVSLDGDETQPAPTPEGGGETDSAEARNFRAAALQLQARMVVRPPEPPPRQAFDIDNGRLKLAQAIDPKRSFPRRLSGLVKLPDLSLAQPEEIVDVVAHPDFEEAMYAHLRDINKELLIPNLQLIPPDTIALLETNPKFIEAYMVGLNHEMGRELLWREFPTDLRGSYFRQFWDVRGVTNPDTPADAERLKDIVKIHTWRRASPLGSHRPAPPPGAKVDVPTGGKQVVLVIRGELLKRYPNTVVYAQKAIKDARGNVVLRETDPTPDQFAREFKFPLFRAEIDPDLRFFGLDLSTEKAKGVEDSIDFPNDKLGWFFVIQEVPGEPRFGMDIAYTPTVNATPQTSDDPLDTWDNLAWDRFGGPDAPFVSRLPAPVFPRPDHAELDQHPWGASAAQMAYALFQTPVMIAVHAKEMLEFTDA